MTDRTHTRIESAASAWRKSSFSNGTGGDCVELADGLPDLVPVRDSKRARNGADAPVLLFRRRAWQNFVDGRRGT